MNINLETETTNSQIQLPEPDADNITVLTDKLPNTPILPWNHYDSPWDDLEDQANFESSTVKNQESE